MHRFLPEPLETEARIEKHFFSYPFSSFYGFAIKCNRACSLKHALFVTLTKSQVDAFA